jgi:hypothetical protein
MTQHYTYTMIIIEQNSTASLTQASKEIMMGLFQGSYLFTSFIQN